MQLIGTIVRLQVQTQSLKVGVAPQRRYDPAGIQPVPFLEVNDGGVRGCSADGTALDDVHHRDHPSSKNRGENGISILFTRHYEEMRVHFAEHLVDGIAGENILVLTHRHINPSELESGVIIATTDGREIPLVDVIPAPPCVEFSRFALQFPDDQRPDLTVTDAVRYLSDGMRGYYCGYVGTPERVAVGDELYVR